MRPAVRLCTRESRSRASSGPAGFDTDVKLTQLEMLEVKYASQTEELKGLMEKHKKVPGSSSTAVLQQSSQKLKATLANPTIRRFLIHYFEF